MEQGRTNRQIEANNKIMVTFLVAIFAFVLLTYSFRLLNKKSPWMVKIERTLLSKNG
ncbi:hypothetical protein [Pedobacter aquatilis]|uniref:hypothetical protein n=1 Tax=Pedobacter aquatilis TaxID=351343 RepID=UPI002931A18E|nr:hypothetical protein [Pedobacter aquatilis]